jgi:hypothetical protein
MSNHIDALFLNSVNLVFYMDSVVFWDVTQRKLVNLVPLLRVKQLPPLYGVIARTGTILPFLVQN